MAALLLLNKPYGVLCQFTPDGSGKPTLADYVQYPGVYPAGRLDTASEGLLALTDSGALQARISEPRRKLPKTYWVQVEGLPGVAALEKLRRGVELKDGLTAPARVCAIEEPELWPREPPIRYRKRCPTSWLQLTLVEGRNRQVRRMTAAVGLPTLRLVRTEIGPFRVNGIEPGGFQRVPEASLRALFPDLELDRPSRARRKRVGAFARRGVRTPRRR